MELILKLPKNKPPFIGIQFEEESEARGLNKGMVNNYFMDFYQLRMMVAEDNSLNLEISSKMNFRYVYENLKVDIDKLNRFLYMTKTANSFNFGHVIKKNDNHEVVQVIATMRNYVLKVNKFEVEFEL